MNFTCPTHGPTTRAWWMGDYPYCAEPGCDRRLSEPPRRSDWRGRVWAIDAVKILATTKGTM